jgi:hypothetical protein
MQITITLQVVVDVLRFEYGLPESRSITNEGLQVAWQREVVSNTPAE